MTNETQNLNDEVKDSTTVEQVDVNIDALFGMPGADNVMLPDDKEEDKQPSVFSKPKDIDNYFSGNLVNVKVDVPVDGLNLYKRMIERNLDSCKFYLKKYNEYKAANN